VKATRSLTRIASIGAISAGLIVGVAGPSQANTLISQLYRDANYGGTVYSHHHPDNGYACTLPLEDEITRASMPSFDNQTSSFKVYSGCWAQLYEHTNFGGAILPYQPTTSFVGAAMNDRASSVKYS